MKARRTPILCSSHFPFMFLYFQEICIAAL
uniref:Uncharacterized protein n=1 Tax=Anguilla anguilla TaxID=7936 RepID=A0A0E9U6L6_ANGAN